LPQRLKQLKTGAARKHDVEDNEFMLGGQRGLQPTYVIVGGVDMETVPHQESLKQVYKAVVVIDNKQVVHRGYCAFSDARLR
jgi:hypothetical protein